VGRVLTSKVLGATETLGGFRIIGEGNNQTGYPIVSPGRLSVATYGGTKFPNEGKVQGSPGEGVPPLVLPGFDAINTDLT
jgi:hypothetical protein